MIELIIFDFDGVIIDSFPQQFDFLKHLGKKLGKKFDYSNPEELKKVWKEPFYPDFFKFLGYDVEKEEDVFSEEYSKIMTKVNSPLQKGIEEVLRIPYVKQKKLAIASSNTNEVINKQLTDHKLEWYFNIVIGKNDLPVENGRKKSKPNPHCLLRVLERTGYFPREAIYVGDQYTDIIAAKNVAIYAKEPIKTIAVTYGFGSREKLEEQKPDYLVNSTKELGELLNCL